MNVCMLALMAMIPSHSIPIIGEPCRGSGYTKAWNELLHPASLAKKDTRYGLHEGGPKYGLTNAETEWISRVTGNVICPGDRPLKGKQGSAGLLGRNDLIATAAHNLRNKDGSLRADWAECYFESQSQPPVRRKLKIFDSGTIFGTKQPDIDRDLDYVNVRLDEPILGVEPIPISANAANIKPGQKLLVVSSYQEDMKKDRKVLPNEPVIQECVARDINPVENLRNMVVYTDCSGMEGASGSILFMRDETNQLVGVGIHARGGPRALDGKPYDKTADTGNHSTEIMFEGPFARDLQRSLGIQSGL